MELRKNIRKWSGVARVKDKPFCGKKLPTTPDVFEHFLHHLKIKKYAVKKATSATYEKIIAVWKKVAQGAIYTCYLSRSTILKKLNDFYKVLK